jgi:hypothetical protein
MDATVKPNVETGGSTIWKCVEAEREQRNARSLALIKAVESEIARAEQIYDEIEHTLNGEAKR